MTYPVEPLSPEAIHAVLMEAFGQVSTLRGNVDGVSCDSAFAIGECLGQLSKAKALVGRDIDGGKSALATSSVQRRVGT